MTRPIRITLSTHGGMLREHARLKFQLPPNMRVAVFAPPFCSTLSSGAQNVPLSDAHKIYEPGEEMPEMTLNLMHTYDTETFAVQERKSKGSVQYHYLTANGQPLRTNHFPELERFERVPMTNQQNIVTRDVSASQFLTMLLNRYGEERSMLIKLIACRSDYRNNFAVSYDPVTKNTFIKNRNWNTNEERNQRERRRVLKRMYASGNQENLNFARNVVKKLKSEGTSKQRFIRLAGGFNTNKFNRFRTELRNNGLID